MTLVKINGGLGQCSNCTNKNIKIKNILTFRDKIKSNTSANSSKIIIDENKSKLN
jgi:hypothetical protein